MEPAIVSSEFSFSYGKNKLFDRSKINLRSGDRKLIIGSNGSGKTTLLRLLSGSLLPDEGQIIVTGKLYCVLGPLGEFKSNYTLKNNLQILRLSNQTLSKMSFLHVCEMFCEFAMFSTQKLNNQISHLSNGEQLRLALFALAHSHADIFVFDEFIGGVDQQFWKKTQYEIEKKIHDAKILLIASHNVDYARQFNCEISDIKELVR